MFQSASILCIGIVMLLLSTRSFVILASRVAVFLRISPLVIGLTVVSIGTSLPELAVSGIAVVRGDTGLAVGNIIGSNIINVFLVLGIGILAGKLRVGTAKTQRTIFILLACTGLFMLLYFLRIPGSVAGSILLVTALTITIAEYMWGVSGRDQEDVILYRNRKPSTFTLSEGGFLIASLSGIVAGGVLTVTAVEGMSLLLGISTTILGLSVTAIATSLPELFTTIISERNHEEKITIGNLIGSNIYNLTLIGGLILLFTSWETITSYEIIMLTVSTILFFALVIIYKGKNIPKISGVLLLLIFGLYLVFLE